VDCSWICVVLNKNLYARGIEVATQEIRRLAGESFIDFRMVDDGFDGDCYSFLKCRKDVSMEGFRKCPHVVSVLDSYDNPTFLGDDEVQSFIQEEEHDALCTRYGDMVIVEGESPFAGLSGVVIKEQPEESLVLFRFHTITKRKWLRNDELIVTGNVFKYLKLPVTNLRLQKGHGKSPVITERTKGVNTGECDRSTD